MKGVVLTGCKKRPFKVGLTVPYGEGRMGGKTARWSDIATMCKLAEDVGFDSVWVPDHFLYREEIENQIVETRGGWECWSLVAAIAAITERVEIGQAVICTAYRNPALLAHMAATVDEISDGRLVLGLGAGWHEPEFSSLGLPFDRRVSRFEEAIQILRGLLRDGKIDFDGKYYQARDAEIVLRGPREHGPPILVGSDGPRMLRIAARYADIWNAFVYMYGNVPDGIPPLRDMVDEACRDVGRDPESMERTASVLVALSDARGIRTITEPPISGSPNQIAEQLSAFAPEGISHLMIVPDPCTPSGIEEFASVLEILDSA